MDKIISLKSDALFKKIYKKGASSVQPSLVLYARRNGLKCNRLGITTSKKIGNAVIRNRSRRRLREIYRAYFGQLKEGYDFILVARVRTAGVPHLKLDGDFFRAISDLGVVRDA